MVKLENFVGLQLKVSGPKRLPDGSLAGSGLKMERYHLNIIIVAAQLKLPVHYLIICKCVT